MYEGKIRCFTLARYTSLTLFNQSLDLLTQRGRTFEETQQMKYSVLFCILACAVIGQAQDEGVIIYQEKTDVHRRLPKDRQEFKEMIPQYRVNYYELHFTPEASLYRVGEEPEEQVVEGGDGRRHFRMHMAMPERTVYKNLPENKMVDSRVFLTKKFLIRGNLDEIQWKISEGQKQILNYFCMKAEFRDTTDHYVAWFTPQIPIPNGPGEYSGLPGMILQVDMNDGERVITATELTETEIDESLLKEPTKGKEVTSGEFREIVREKMQEMHGQSGGPRMHIIRQ